MYSISNLLNFPASCSRRIYPKPFLVVSTLNFFQFPKISARFFHLGQVPGFARAISTRFHHSENYFTQIFRVSLKIKLDAFPNCFPAGFRLFLQIPTVTLLIFHCYSYPGRLSNFSPISNPIFSLSENHKTHFVIKNFLTQSAIDVISFTQLFL